MPWREKNTSVGVVAGGEAFSRYKLKKLIKTGSLLGCYGRIFHGTGNSAQLSQILEFRGGVVE